MKFLHNKLVRKLIIVLFISLGILSIFLIPKIKINYDMRTYLPEESNTKQALDVLEKEFGNTSMVQLMTKNLSIEKADDFVNEITDYNHIKSVIWLGAIEDIKKPVELMDQKSIEEFYKDEFLLFTIEFDRDDYDLEVSKTISSITNLLNKDEIEHYFRGPAIQNQSARDKLNNEMFWIFLVAIPFALIILFLAAKSWFEPVIILINLGIAILLNMGTSFLLDSVSYITIAITAVLQLAMSLDYSLFLVHRYYEKRDEGLQPKEASIESTKEAFKSVTASALTTIFGFLALLLMGYRLGEDIGLSLAKAIFFSYLTSIVLLPLLLVAFDNVLIRLKRNRKERSYKKLSTFFNKTKYLFLIFIVAIGIFSFTQHTKVNYQYGDNSVKDENDPTNIAEQEIQNVFGSFQPVVILYHNNDKGNALALANKLKDLKHITQIQSLVTSIDPSIPEDLLPQEALDQFKGKNYSRMIVYTDLNDENDEMYEFNNTIVTLTKETLVHDSYLVGVPIAVTEIKNTVTFDGVIVQIASALLIAVVIAIFLNSSTIPILLVLIIEISIWINLSISALFGGSVVYIGYLVVTSLQLGATIDYAVLLTSRYQEFREFYEPKKAIEHSISKSLPAIAISMIVLAAVGFVVSIVSKLGVVSEIGLLIGRGALLSGFLVIFVLPSLLLLTDKIIIREGK